MKIKTNQQRRERRHLRSRQRIQGTPERPRLAVYVSGRHTYAQVIDDVAQRTLVSASSGEKDFARAAGAHGTDVARSVGRLAAERAVAAGIGQVVLDRGGCSYAGRVKALAEAAREAGLNF